MFHKTIFLCLCCSLLALSPLVQAEPTAKLQKNQGQRWVVVPKMMTFLNNMDKELQAPAPSSIKAHHQLGDRLNKSIKSLVASCTMTGQAHDELHNWLVPFITDVKHYRETNDLATLQNQHKALQKAFLVFHDYFQ